jgi:hypothetical protein
MARRKLPRRRPLVLEEVPDATAASEVTVDEPAESSGGEAEFDAEFEDEFGRLYADDSEALERWKQRLSSYVDLQGTLDALRLRPSSEQPWPAFDNPMLGYLKERSSEIAANDGLDAALAWLAANAWFEGAIAERSRFIRLLDAD